MVVDLVVTALAGIVEWVLSWLPTSSVQLPSIAPLSSRILEVDSLVPIAGPIVMAAYLLPFVLVFLLVRLVLMIRHVLLP
jgi:hypothetical protein